MNGSYVNGSRVESRVPLQDGDFIRVGQTEFFFFLSSGYRKLDAIHPEILNRLLNPEDKGNPHIDYAEIREEISFNLNR
jgi:pSer/pThr/pTyr-binding forkhead associated (FHA) protein